MHRSARRTGARGMLRRLGLGAALVLGLLQLSGPAVAADVADCFGRAPTIVGTSGNDTIRGTKSRDVIVGRDGDDVIRGLGRRDIICGGAGDDVVYDGRRNDTIDGGDGQDELIGGRGTDTVKGGDGADALRGGNRLDFLLGERGDDVLRGGPGGDQLYGGPGSDVMWGDDGDDRFFLADMTGDEQDVAHGGTGGNSLEAMGMTAGVTMDLDARSVSGATITSFVFDDIRNAAGSPFADDLTGTSGDNWINGLQGSDVIDGGPGGTDLLIGDEGDDELDAADGEAGDEVFGDDGIDGCAADAGDAVYSCEAT
jgi:hypothetical protein